MAMLKCYCAVLLIFLHSVSIKAFDDREWNQILREIAKQLPVLVEDQLIDLLKYHRYDKMLSKGHTSEIERLDEGFHHMKGRMNQVSRRLRSAENNNEVLRSQFKKSTAYSHKLEKELNALKAQVRDIERNVSTAVKARCSCKSSPSNNNVRATMTTESTELKVPRPTFSSIVAVNADGSDLVKIDLRSRKVKELKATVEGRISATTYDPKSNSIIWSKVKSFWFNDRTGPRIYSTPLDSLEEETQIHPSGASALTIDSRSNWLFFTTTKPRKSISRIRPTGGDFTQIHGMGDFSDLQDIAVDPQKQLIYTCDGDNLIETDYQGKQKKILVKGGFIVTLTLGARNTELYYYNHDKLKKFNLTTGKEVVAKSKLDMIPKDLIYEDGKLYYGAFFQGAVKVLDLKSSRITDIGSLGGTGISMCLVP